MDASCTSCEFLIQVSWHNQITSGWVIVVCCVAIYEVVPRSTFLLSELRLPSSSSNRQCSRWITLKTSIVTCYSSYHGRKVRCCWKGASSCQRNSPSKWGSFYDWQIIERERHLPWGDDARCLEEANGASWAKIDCLWRQFIVWQKLFENIEYLVRTSNIWDLSRLWTNLGWPEEWQ
jgi:hypothetical protein